jgi:NADH-quinone oxidoreductase subunit C
MDSSLSNALDVARKRGFEVLDAPYPSVPSVIAPLDSFKAYLFEAKSAGFKLLADVMGIDYLTYTAVTPERFAVVYNLTNPVTAAKLTVKVFVADGARVPTVTDLWPGANFPERETYDFFGIEFEGHPDLRKILTPEDLDGHALRKDFPLGETPTLFREGRFIDPAAFRAGLSGRDAGLTGWRGGARKDSSDDREPPTGPTTTVSSENPGGKQ